MSHSQPYSRQYTPPAPILSVTIRNAEGKTLSETVTALVDSGSDASMIPLNIMQKIEASYLRTMQMRWGTSPPELIDLYLVSIRISSQEISGIKAIAMPDYTEVILGRDVLNQLEMTLNGLALETIIH